MTERDWGIEFARNIRIQLQRKHMKQKELAEKANITEVTMTRYMRGERIPRANIISRFASILECSADELIPNDWDCINTYLKD